MVWDLAKIQCVIREFSKCLEGIQDLSAQSGSGIRQTVKKDQNETILGVVEINDCSRCSIVVE